MNIYDLLHGSFISIFIMNLTGNMKRSQIVLCWPSCCEVYLGSFLLKVLLIWIVLLFWRYIYSCARLGISCNSGTSLNGSKGTKIPDL